MNRGILLIAVTTFALSASVHGHQGGRVYPILEVTGESGIDLKDGVVDDWYEVIGEPSFTTLDFTVFESHRRSAATKALDPSNLDFRIWLGWGRNPARLYVAAIFSDNAFAGPDSEYLGQAIGGHQDHMYLKVDGDHDGAPRADFGAGDASEVWERDAQLYHAFSIPAHGQHVSLRWLELFFEEDHPWWSYPPYADGGGSVSGENPVFWVVEFYATPFDMLIRDEPERSLVSELFPGKTIGFQLEVWDFDDPEPVRDDYVSEGLYTLGDYSGLTVRDVFGDADTWADGILIGEESAGDPGSVVKMDSWARIKASLRD